MARLFSVTDPMPKSKAQLKSYAGVLSQNRTDRPGDYAQSLMDLGSSICTPKSPKCLFCPIQSFCNGHKMGIAETLPRRQPKKAKPHKYGYLCWIENDTGEILLETRHDHEMLGGMVGFPTTPWAVEQELLPKIAVQTDLSVKHSFTHFDLTLKIIKLPHENNMALPQNNHFWVSLSKCRGMAFPTLFKKAYKLMLE